jgi:squalene-associated FAD-dependent desaturase
MSQNLQNDSSEVLIVGAGLAGMAAAVALSAAGVSVILAERKPYIGGRAYSYPHPALDEVIDSQHVMLGCCTNLIDLCERSGSAQHIRWYDDIVFLEAGVHGHAARRSRIGPAGLPAPAHSALSFLAAPMLSTADKFRIGTGLTDFLRGYPASDEEPFSAWLMRTRQTKRAIRHFWEPVIVGALNDSFERCSTRYAGQVFYESFLKSPAGGRLGIPTLPMTEFYKPVAEFAQRQGTELRLRSSIEKLERVGDMWRAHASDGAVYTVRQVILALPFEQAARLLASLGEDNAGTLPGFSAFSHAPITTLHLWFDREVTDLDHAALLDTRIQWVFNKTRIRRAELSPTQDGQYLELVISASFAELGMTREALVAAALEELSSFFPSAREARLLKTGVLKEARATFSVLPGLDKHRPKTQTSFPGLFLAGDWVRTGWPSTMEGAVRSGRMAAEAAAAATGAPQTFLTPDLPAEGFMRLLGGRLSPEIG